MNQIVIGKIISIYKTYALVQTTKGIGICHISNFSDYKINDLEKFIRMYNPKKFVIINSKKNDGHTLDLSFKACNQIFCFPNNKLEHFLSGFTKLKQFVYHLVYLESKKSKLVVNLKQDICKKCITKEVIIQESCNSSTSEKNTNSINEEKSEEFYF